MMKKITLILSGGAGTRLWPVSRSNYPKPFIKIGGVTLLERAVIRAIACGSDEIYIVTNQEYLFLTQNIITEIENKPKINFILEPLARNTASAISMATIDILNQHGQDVFVLVLAADHSIPDESEFVANVLDAYKLSQDGDIIIFGVKPTRPETGFGYIEVSNNKEEAQKVLSFKEKPSFEKASEYYLSGLHYWNSGMFCFQVITFINSMNEYANELLMSCMTAYSTLSVKKIITDDSRIITFEKKQFILLPNISIDYALIEKAKNIIMLPAKFRWSDVGSWPSVSELHTADMQGNAMYTNNDSEWICIDTSNTYIHSDNTDHRKIIATIGVNNLVVVDTSDAILVMNKSNGQDVKVVVDKLKLKNIHSLEHRTTVVPSLVLRPWGNYRVLKDENGYKVKRIEVKPGEKLSLQFHHHRSEHWIVVHGRGIVQIGESEFRTNPGKYHYIPLNQNHRLTNTGEETLVLIEVQFGDYLGEDDIVRLEDKYGRS